jgi:glycosyltransferase involved in cell wall biosynthesis
MNIAFFSESYKPYVSGVTNSIETLKKGLEELGHQVIVFSPSYPNSGPLTDVFRFPSIPAPYPGYRITIPVPGKYLDLLKTKKINIIHSHSPYQLGLLSMNYAKKLKVPFIFTMHTILSQYMHYIPLVPQSVSSFLMDAYIRWFCNRCGCVIVPTKKVMDQLRSTGIKSRIEIIPTGIDMTLVDKASASGIRGKYGIPDDAKLLLFVGRLAREKNLLFLLKAFELIQKKKGNVYLLIAAGGPMEKELKAAAPGNVIFAGAIGYPEVFNYYKASDIFVFSSLSETQGLVLAEAMACSVPQVAVDAEGASDVVKDGVTGYLTSHSEEAFSSAVLRLIEDEGSREKMSRSSIETARSVYSKEVFAQKIELIYKSMI